MNLGCQRHVCVKLNLNDWYVDNWIVISTNIPLKYNSWKMMGDRYLTRYLILFLHFRLSALLGSATGPVEETR